ncbi:MAG: fibronectin type III domain-containing protein, partial [Lachnospiraceae bacterium]|nr:fibronectin type III domain-containing protein [Lachnospiraceae bacterium]
TAVDSNGNPIPDDGFDTAKEWSKSVKLTDSKGYVDGPALATLANNTMAIVYNQYDLTLVPGSAPTEEEKAAGITGEKVQVSDVKFMGGVLEAFGSVEAKDIVVSNDSPKAGDEVTVDMNFENTGLTAAKDGFEAVISLKKGSTKQQLTTFEYDESLVQAGSTSYSFTFEATEDMDGAVLEVQTTERGANGYTTTQSEPFKQTAEYTIISNDSYQDADSEFYANVVVENTGNVATKAGDVLKVFFAGPYMTAEAYGLSTDVLATENISLEPGESKEFKLKLNVPAEAFGKYGYIRTQACVVDSEDNKYDVRTYDDAYMYQPAELKIGDGSSITMKEGTEKTLTLNYVSTKMLQSVSPMFISDNPSVVSVSGNKITAVGAGEANITAYANPYDASTTIKVKVDGKYGTDDSILPGETVLKPGTPTVKQVTDTSATVSWKKVSGANGYQVMYATNKAFTKAKTVSTTKLSATLKKLAKNKTYYFKVRAYKKSGTSNVYSGYSGVKALKLIKTPTKPTMKLAKAQPGRKATLQWKKIKGAVGYQVIYTTDKKFKKKVKSVTTNKTKLTLKKLKKNKTYYFKVRAYKKNAGAKLYGKYGKMKKIKITK